jgi:prepilin-type N-terminal cleavage/methylation domain-containing protein
MIGLGFARAKRSEKGFTLVEMLVVLFILGGVMSVMSTAVVLILRTSEQNNEWNVNLRQVQNAGYYISRDALMAQAVTTTKPGCFLSLSWSEWNGNPNTIDYYYDAFDNKKLMRRLNNDTPTLVAEYIVPESTTCYWDDVEKKLTVTIRASLSGSRFAVETYEIKPRPMIGGG